MQLSFQLNPDPEAPSLARAAILPLGAHVSPVALDDLALILSELIANSVMHGPSRRIEVDVMVDDDGVIRGEVRDQGAGVIAIRGAVADDDGGFGLRLVDRLAARWGVHEGSTNVWFELPSQ